MKWERSEDSVVNLEIPNSDATADFWRRIWSASVDHTEGFITPITAIKIGVTDVKYAISSASSSSHSVFATQSVLQGALDSRSLPIFLSTGVTFLSYKSEWTCMTGIG